MLRRLTGPHKNRYAILMGTRRTTCTVCGGAPCYAFLSIQLYFFSPSKLPIIDFAKVQRIGVHGEKEKHPTNALQEGKTEQKLSDFCKDDENERIEKEANK